MNAAAVDAGTSAAYVGPGWGSLLWFLLIIAAIPLVLWVLKRTPWGGATGAGAAGGVAHAVGQLSLSAQHKVVTVEVGQGADRRWLVLGVTPQSITTLHTMAPQAATPEASVPGAAPPGFATLLHALRPPRQP
jgi:flagellar protein FliO/FliZ